MKINRAEEIEKIIEDIIDSTNWLSPHDKKQYIGGYLSALIFVDAIDFDEYEYIKGEIDYD